MLKIFSKVSLSLLLILGILLAQSADSTDQSNYRIEKPGTITFTVSTKIKGKVDKPQVMIFLPKERSYFRELDLTKSFKEEIKQSMPLVPLAE